MDYVDKFIRYKFIRYLSLFRVMRAFQFKFGLSANSRDRTYYKSHFL